MEEICNFSDESKENEVIKKRLIGKKIEKSFKYFFSYAYACMMCMHDQMYMRTDLQEIQIQVPVLGVPVPGDVQI